jgi:hypothetical protein
MKEKKEKNERYSTWSNMMYTSVGFHLSFTHVHLTNSDFRDITIYGKASAKL